MTFQSHPWYWRLWRKLAQWLQPISSHQQLTTPALFRAPGASEVPSGRKVSAMQWSLNDYSSSATDHNHGIVRVEVELITDPLESLPVHLGAVDLEDPNLRITHFPSNRLH